MEKTRVSRAGTAPGVTAHARDTPAREDNDDDGDHSVAVDRRPIIIR